MMEVILIVAALLASALFVWAACWFDVSERDDDTDRPDPICDDCLLW